ncbi:hypothetical protein CEK26_009024 [Fusarium fujikuroi]|uniref:Uncharacterized protein n=1 Tax=Fusarium fujikuroi TaxID=5127 RepID=A0A5Q3DE34_FUSFU|nr:hypothetical protein CEK27_009042 [Fusarium fujikuroi]QGI82325.1 hypothetical protein CEK25_009054 [Fusarium fujikuroi]QGI95955.1 hypothetical protein CEK26_009024 [Fusarium fujikuroi]VTT62554.1 unnamed protein product [Fusarium fujikuroi]VTT68018.1 unnamed protein product [Fusarium fujikuroi]
MDVSLEQLSEMSISPRYWGIYTSLYSSLPPEAVKQLERAIWLKMSGLANEARAIFGNELGSFAAVPVVAIEHADLELEAGKWGRAWGILNSELLRLREAKEDLESPEHRLMLLTWAMLGTRHRGDVTSSAIEIERTQHWLAGVPVEEYTDIQAGCIRRYVIASLFTRLYSGYNNPESEHIPLHGRTDASGERIPWGGLQLLRRSLTQRGMFNEANALFRAELNRTPPEDRGPVVNEFLEAVASIPLSRGRDYIDAVVRLQWATTHIQLQAPESAVEEFGKSEAAFQRFCDEFGIRNKEATPHMQAMAYERLLCINDPIDKLERTEELAAHMEAVDGTKTGYCLAAAADLSRKYYEVTGMELFRTTYFDVLRRLDTYDQTVSEDICDLVHHHVDLNSVALASLIDRDKALDWIDDFFKQYPHFDAPVVRALLLRSQASLLRSLRRQDEAGRIDEEASRLETSTPSVGNWMHSRQSRRDPTKRGTTPSVQQDTQNQVQDDDGEETFYWGWSDAIGDQAKIQEMSIQLVLTWLLEDIATGNSALEEFKSMKEAALKAIVFPKATDIDEPTEERYTRLCAWLSKPPVHQKNRRLFCLVMLRFGRQMHFSDLQLWDLRLSELKSLLELEESLPQIIRDKFPGSKGSWLSQIALTYMAPLDYWADFTSAESGERFSNAQTYNDRALAEFRRNKDLVRVALHQRSGAQICMFMIRRIRQLEQQAASSNDTKGRTAENRHKVAENDIYCLSDYAKAQIHDLRNRGISQAEEADEIFSMSELHASTSSGLEGITHRQSITAGNANAFTVLTAIELLLAAPGEPSDETITKVWQWVQKFKARSLARTIGVRMSAPLELVSKIKAYPEAARGYDEMMELEQRIEKAEGMAKFNLRRQLDMHRRTMRDTHDLLRQLLDLKEAQPFDLSDVARITAQSGTSIVLVDWFYLPPYFTGDVGRFFLFTTKNRSKRNINIKLTMDMLATKVGDVVDWMKTYLTPESFKDIQEENLDTPEARKAFDSMLGGLIAPLSRHVKPGELVVLCPSSSLHRLPLHALAIGGHQALIHRNPVVYTHSQSLLRSCFAATEVARPSLAPINVKFISGIAESESTYLKAGRASIQTLAREFHTDPMIDRTASKKDFLTVAGKSRLLHMHTHCGWGSKDPLDHMVEFPMPFAPPNEQRPVESVTAREFFDILVSPGTHINMIACQGGVVDVPLGDEVLGLVPALMCSGASSTVSTLWKINDTHGSRFSKLFFDSFSKQSTSTDGNTSKAGGSLIVNLAKAMQVAAQAMDHSMNQDMDDEKQEPLYRWAGYVLHGCWQFLLSGQDIKSLHNR